MESVRNKVFNELFLAPSVVLPIVAGASAWLISWAVGGVGTLNLAGLVGVLGGLGWMATRVIFQVDTITERTLKKLAEKEAKEEELRLDQLAAKLRSDRDPRAADSLTLLREHRRQFEEIAKTPELQSQSLHVVSQFQQLFKAALEQLDESYKLSQLAEKLQSSKRAETMRQRSQLLDEVDETIRHMADAVDHFRQLEFREQNRDLNSLREELELSLQSARRAEERMREFERAHQPDRKLFE